MKKWIYAVFVIALAVAPLSVRAQQQDEVKLEGPMMRSALENAIMRSALENTLKDNPQAPMDEYLEHLRGGNMTPAVTSSLEDYVAQGLERLANGDVPEYVTPELAEFLHEKLSEDDVSLGTKIKVLELIFNPESVDAPIKELFPKSETGEVVPTPQAISLALPLLLAKPAPQE